MLARRLRAVHDQDMDSLATRLANAAAATAARETEIADTNAWRTACAGESLISRLATAGRRERDSR